MTALIDRLFLSSVGERKVRLVNVASRHSGNTMVAGRPKCNDEEGMMDTTVVSHQLNYPRVENSNMSLLFTMDIIRCGSN